LQLVNNYVGSGDFLKLADVSSRTITLIESAGRQSDDFGWGLSVYGALHAFSGVAWANLGDFRRGEALCEKGLRFAQEVNDLRITCLTETCYGTVCVARGDGRRAVAYERSAIKHAEELQFLNLLGSAWQISGQGYLLMGDTETAREHAEKGHECDLALGWSLTPALHYYIMSDISLESGDWESARRYAEEGSECARTHGERQYEGILGIRLGRALAKADPSQSPKAEGLILGGITLREELKWTKSQAEGYLYLGELYGDTGRRQEALEALNKAEGMFREMGTDYWLARAEKALMAVQS
jgi:tetratricopeptide (TPR) repeat protein